MIFPCEFKTSRICESILLVFETSVRWIFTMKVFVAIVINLAVLVQISQSHTIKPTIILAPSEPNNDDDGVTQVNEDDNIAPETNPNNTCNALFLWLIFRNKKCRFGWNNWSILSLIGYEIEEETSTDASAASTTTIAPPKEDELIFAHVVSVLIPY